MNLFVWWVLYTIPATRINSNRRASGGRNRGSRGRCSLNRPHPYNLPNRPSFPLLHQFTLHAPIVARAGTLLKFVENEKEINTKTKDKRKMKHRLQTKTPNDNCAISDESCYISRSPEDWFADSGATLHMSDLRKFYKTLTPVEHVHGSSTELVRLAFKVAGHCNIDFTT